MLTGETARFTRALQVLREAYPDLTLQQVLTFLHIADHEGARMFEIAEAMGTSIAVASRNVRRMTCPDYAGSLGRPAGLLRLLRGETDGKARHVVVSDDGRALLDRLHGVLRDGAA